MFKSNVGLLDRVIRLVVGAAILAAGYASQSYWGLLGLIPLVTAFVGFCPVYRPFGINTGGKSGGCCS